MFADIDAIRARAALPPETTTITIDGWGDFRCTRITLAEKQAFQAAVRANDGQVGQAAATILAEAAHLTPALTAEDIALFWGHPDYAAGLESLINQIATWCQATPGAAQEAVQAARAGFPDRADGPDGPDGVGPVRAGAVAADRGDDALRVSATNGLERLPHGVGL